MVDVVLLKIQVKSDRLLEIPDHKVDFVIELINHLGLKSSEEYEIPEEHKEIVRERIRTSTPDKLVSWYEARKKLNFLR